MLKIRLARIGKRNDPFYRVVISEHTRTPNAKALEILGTYNTKTDPATIELKEDRVKYWLEKGAQYSPTIGDILVKKGLIEKDETKYTSKNPKKSKKEKAKDAAAEEKKAEEQDEKKEEKPAEEKEDKKEEAKPADKPEDKPKEEAKPEEKPKEEKKPEEPRKEEKPKEDKKPEDKKDA